MPELGLHQLAELLDLLAALADDDAGTGAVDVDLDLGIVSFNFDLGDAGGIEGGFEVLTDVVVLDDEITDFVVTGHTNESPNL